MFKTGMRYRSLSVLLSCSLVVLLCPVTCALEPLCRCAVVPLCHYSYICFFQNYRAGNKLNIKY